ncbi:MAG TPA: hypothetical protein VE736_04400 [Gaiellaceae bacterium]|jgi:hypothetical protein|nr:hypothetical protein [Gaiellaceae bacterium]
MTGLGLRDFSPEDLDPENRLVAAHDLVHGARETTRHGPSNSLLQGIASGGGGARDDLEPPTFDRRYRGVP